MIPKRLTLGPHTLEPSAVVPLAEEEWARLKHDWSVSEDDRLYFACDGQVYEATLAQETRLTDLVMRAMHQGVVAMTYDGQPAQFLRSEDAERFQGRIGRANQ
jgi:hypothetical protein